MPSHINNRESGASARAKINQSFDEVSVSYIESVKSFGAVGDGVTDDTEAINRAIAHANSNGGGTVRLERGKSYLVSPLESGIVLLSNVALDINHSTLIKAPNGLQNYSIVEVSNASNVCIKNGSIIGDRYQHDYSSGGTHEGGHGVKVINTKNLVIERVRVSGCTGDSIVTGMQRTAYYRNVTANGGGIVSGGINNDGTPNLLLPGYYTPQQLSLSGVTGEWFHLWFRDFSRDYNKANINVRVFYYNNSDVFLEQRTHSMWFMEEMVSNIPAGATGIRIYIAGWLWPIPASARIDLGQGSFGCENIAILDCELFDSRRQGYSVTGARNVRMERTHIHDIKGTSPESGVDIEDGTNTSISFSKCVFENNKNNFLNVSGIDVVIDSCRIDTNATSAEVALTTATTEITVTNSTICRGQVTTSGKTRISNCTFEECSFSGAPRLDGINWEANTSYIVGDKRVPARSTGFVYEAKTAGTSGSSEPIWPGVVGQTVADSSITWECVGYSSGIKDLVVASGTSFIRCNNNYTYTTNMHGTLRFTDCTMDSCLIGGPSSVYQNVQFHLYSSTNITGTSVYSNCTFRAYTLSSMTFLGGSRFVDCEITRQSTNAGFYIRFMSGCEVSGGKIVDVCTTPNPIELGGQVRFRNVLIQIHRNINYFSEGVYVAGPGVTLDGVSVEHQGSVNTLNSAIVGLGENASGFSARKCIFATNGERGPVVYTRSGSPTYEMLGCLLVGCDNPDSVYGVNRIIGSIEA